MVVKCGSMETMEKLLDELDGVRERLLTAVDPLPDAALTQPNAIGRYAIADVLVNLTVWEAELVTGMMWLDQGKKPANLLVAMADRKRFNRERFQENRGRDLDRIFDDLQQVRVQLESWLESFSENSLTNAKKYPWFQGKSLAAVIAALTYENEAKYVPLIEAFAMQWEADAEE